MKTFLGWLAGLATVWAVLAIWRRFPGIPDLDYEEQ